MKTLTQLIALSMLLSISFGLNQCPQHKTNGKKLFDFTKNNGYFAKIPVSGDGDIIREVADFDNDRDSDIIIGANDNSDKIRFYFFENDGNGNFKRRQYTSESKSYNPKNVDYFASITGGSSCKLISKVADFNRDSYPDMVVGVRNDNYDDMKLYHFSNDGKGNLELKESGSN
jgi:hypothetical protein